MPSKRPTSPSDDSDSPISPTNPASVSSTTAYTCHMPGCSLDSPERRVVSHFFGRNKKETRAIPEDCWVFYCRQHYQRSRYRMKTTQFGQKQMDLVRATVQNLETKGIIVCWDISLRKRALELVVSEDMARSTSSAAGGGLNAACPERMLLPFTGKEKSFADVYALVGLVRDYCIRNNCEPLEFEIVPQFRPGFMLTRPASKRAAKGGTHHSAGGSSGAAASSSGGRRSSKGGK